MLRSSGMVAIGEFVRAGVVVSTPVWMLAASASAGKLPLFVWSVFVAAGSVALALSWYERSPGRRAFVWGALFGAILAVPALNVLLQSLVT